MDGLWAYAWKKLNFEIVSDTGNPKMIFYTEMHDQTFIFVRFMPKVFNWISCVQFIKVNGDLRTDCIAFLSYFHCMTILIHKQITAYVSCLPSLACTRRRRIPELLVTERKTSLFQSVVRLPTVLCVCTNHYSSETKQWKCFIACLSTVKKGLTTQRMIL